MNIADLTNTVIVPGCPETLVQDALLQGAQQFARDTRVWDEEIEIGLAQGQPIFVDPPPDAAIVEITRVTVDGKRVPYTYSDGAIDAGKAEGELRVHAALEPASDSTELPEALVRWKHAIQAYARAELFSMEGQLWSDLNAAAQRLAFYNQQVTDARVQRSTGQTAQPLRVKPAIL